MPLTKATTNVINLNKDTSINGLTVGRGAGSNGSATAVGVNALSSNTSGENNTGIGYNALDNNTTGTNNTAVGTAALSSNTSGQNNIAVGTAALESNTIGAFNIAVGVLALNSNTTGSNNTAVGESALKNNTTGTYNVAVGWEAHQQNTTGTYNVAVGGRALYNNIDGEHNTACGHGALRENNGDNNTASGYLSLLNNTTGSNNTAIGQSALVNNTTGGDNTAHGVSALSGNTTFSNASGLGFNAQVTGSNQVQLGGSSTTTYAYGAVQDRSDIRDKADVRNTILGLEFIKSLRPVDFKWDMREDYRPEAPNAVLKPSDLKDDATEEEKAKYALELAAYNAYIVKRDKWLEDIKLSNITHDGAKKRNRFHHGLIAQEVKAVLDSKGIDFGGFQDHSIKGGDDVLSIGYIELIAPLIKAVQELSAKVAELEAK